jgi:hypothetical protein
VRLWASGMSPYAAIAQATAAAARPEPSVFAGLRRRHPGLVPQVLRKVTLLVLTRGAWLSNGRLVSLAGQQTTITILDAPDVPELHHRLFRAVLGLGPEQKIAWGNGRRRTRRSLP